MDAALAAAKAKQTPQQHERAHKEALRGMIAAKRDVSYVQLALDLRRSQTTKLETFAVRRTATLKQVMPLHNHVYLHLSCDYVCTLRSRLDTSLVVPQFHS